MTEWREIATAPKDGSRVLVYRPDATSRRKIGIDSRTPDKFDGAWQHSRPDEQPSHWMPLPAPPGMRPTSPLP